MTERNEVQQCFLKHMFERDVETPLAASRAAENVIMYSRSRREPADDELLTFKVRPVELLALNQAMAVRHRHVNPFAPEFRRLAIHQMFDAADEGDVQPPPAHRRDVLITRAVANIERYVGKLRAKIANDIAQESACERRWNAHADDAQLCPARRRSGLLREFELLDRRLDVGQELAPRIGETHAADAALEQ